MGYLGFGGRIGRLRYLGLTLLLGVALGVLTMVLALPAGLRSGGRAAAAGELLWIVLIVAPPMLYGNAALMAKRFRDIGWAPRYVIPAWAALYVADAVVAATVPALAIADGTRTPVGLFVDLALVAALLLWPGRDPDRIELDVAATRRAYRAAGGFAAPASTPMPAPQPAGPGGFGRRGL